MLPPWLLLVPFKTVVWLGVRTSIVTDCQTETSFFFKLKKEKKKKKKGVKIELAGNQRPQEELAYRKLPSSVTRWEIFFPCITWITQRQDGFTHTFKSVLSQDNLACNLVWLGRKGTERLFLFSSNQQSRKDPRRCFVHCISKFQLLSFKIKTLKCSANIKHQNKVNKTVKDTPQSRGGWLQWFYSYEWALFIVITSHLFRSLHAVSLQKYYTYFHCATLIELNSILLNEVYSYRQSLPFAF